MTVDLVTQIENILADNGDMRFKPVAGTALRKEFDRKTVRLLTLFEDIAKEIIGENEDEVVDYFDKNKGRNNLRAEQRLRAAALLGKEE